MADASAATSTSAPAVAAAQEQPEASTSSGKPKRAGIVLAAEKRVTSKLLDSEAGGGREKIFGINECVPIVFLLLLGTRVPALALAELSRHKWADTRRRNIVAGVAGVTADANTLVNMARNVAQGHLQTYNEDMPVEQLVRRICDTKQGYTQFGGASRSRLTFTADRPQDNARSASRSCSPGTTLTSNSSCTRRIRPATTRAGRRAASGPTTRRRSRSCGRTTRTTSGSTTRSSWPSRC